MQRNTTYVHKNGIVRYYQNPTISARVLTRCLEHKEKTSFLKNDNQFKGKLCKGKIDLKICQACIKACPSLALKSPKSRVKESFASAPFDKWACLYYCREIGKKVYGTYMPHGLCGICIKVCPIGMEGIKKRRT